MSIELIIVLKLVGDRDITVQLIIIFFFTLFIDKPAKLTDTENKLYLLMFCNRLRD